MPSLDKSWGAAALGGWRMWRWVYLAMLAAPLLAHIPEYAGLVTCNPIYAYPSMVEPAPHRLLPGSCTIDGNDGTTLQALGGRAAEIWLSGHVPWWNSDEGLGLPLAAEAQPAALFFPFVLLLHFYSGIVVLKLVMQVLTGFFGVALFRELGLSRSACGLGGILLALNGTFAWFAHSQAALPIAFLPALLFGIERCRVRAAASAPGGPVWVALALGYSLVSGFPETEFMNGLLAAVWGASALIRTPMHRRTAMLGKVACGGLAGLALSAPAWMSFADYLRISSIGMHVFVHDNSLPIRQAPTLLLPAIYGPPYANGIYIDWGPVGGFFGPALSILAILALYSGRALAAIRWAMAGWIAIWLSVFLRAPTHALWAAVPVLNAVEVTRYAMPSLETAAAVLAALALDDWRRRPAGVRAIWAVAGFAACALVAVTAGAMAGGLSFAHAVPALFLVGSLVEAAGVAIGLMWLLTRSAGPHRIAALAVLVATDATAQFVLPELAGVRPGRLVTSGPEFLRAHAGLFRTYALNDQVPVNFSSWFGVASIQADSLPFARAWGHAADAIGGAINMDLQGWLVLTPATQLAAFRASATALRAAGVGYVVVSAPEDPFMADRQPDMTTVFSDSRTHIYEMKQAALYFEARGGPCQINAISRERARVACKTPAILIRHELMLPGWYARNHGRKLTVVPGQGLIDQFLQEVALPAGDSDVTWRYTPPHANLIAWLFALGVLGTAGMAGFAAFGKPYAPAAGLAARPAA